MGREKNEKLVSDLLAKNKSTTSHGESTVSLGLVVDLFFLPVNQIAVSHFSLSPPRVAFSRVGCFSRALAFRSLYYP